MESLHLEFKVIEPFKETKEKIELALMVGVTFPNKQVILSPSTHLLCFFKRCYHYDRSLSLPYFFRAGSDRIPYKITKVRGNCGELFLLIRRLSNRSSDKAWYSTRQRNIRVRLLYVTYADELDDDFVCLVSRMFLEMLVYVCSDLLRLVASLGRGRGVNSLAFASPGLDSP